jgi:hypothetical protein
VAGIIGATLAYTGMVVYALRISGGAMTPLSYIPERRKPSAVPGRNGHGYARTRVSTDTPEHNGRRAAKAHVSPSPGPSRTTSAERPRSVNPEPLPRAERQRIQRRNRAIIRKGR